MSILSSVSNRAQRLCVWGFSVLIVLAIAPRSEALDIRRTTKGKILILHRDKGRIQLDTIERDPKGWPVRTERREFRNADESVRAAQSLGFFILPAKPLFEMTPETQELRDDTTPSLWEVKNTWSEEWERKYSVWVEQNVDRDFMVRAGQPSDCADLAYLSRWVFARENKLPIANRLPGTGDFFTQRSVRKEWAKLPTDVDWKKDRRFRAAIDYLLTLTYTHSLMDDSYPIALSSEVFRAGVHHLALTKTSGHTLLVYRTDYADPTSLPFRVFYSTLPVVIRPLIEQAYFYTDQPTALTGGFLRMRWPVLKNGNYSLVRAEDMPGYSLEQYDPKLLAGRSSFGLAVMRKLKPTFSLVVAIREAIQGVRDMIRDRVQLVQDGFAACSKSPSGCPADSQAYDDWSTTSRDARLLAQSDLLSSMIGLGNTDERTQMKAILKEEMAKPVLQLGGESVNLDLVYEALRRKIASDDPNQPIERRWNVRPEGLIPFFTESLITQYRARKAALDRPSTCRNATIPECRPGGARFEIEGTFEIDTALKQVSLYASAYCKTAGPRDVKCVRLEKGLRETPLTINSETKSVREWIDASLWLNSDPRAALAERTSLNPMYQSVEITGMREFHLRDHLAFLRDRDSLRGNLYDQTTAGFVRRAFAPEVSLLDADLHRGQALFSRNQNVFLADLAGHGESTISKFAQPIVEARLLGDGLGGSPRVLVFLQGEWHLLERSTPGAWREIATGAFVEKAAMEPKFDREFLVLRTSLDSATGWSLLDLKSPTPRLIAFAGTPNIGDSNRQSLALKTTIYLQLVQRDSSGELLRTLRVNRLTGTAEAPAWGLHGFVGHVTDDDTVAYFTDIDNGLESTYEAPILANGQLGTRTRLASSFYRMADYIIIYGGIPEMLFYGVGTGGRLDRMNLQPTESWFKHVRAGSIIVAMKDENYGIRRTDSTQTFIEDRFLGVPQAGYDESEYRFLVRGWKSVQTNKTASANSTLLTDQRSPDRSSVLTGMLLGDSLYNDFEPWSVDRYVGVDAVEMDRGVVVNLGSRAFWIGDRD